MALASLKKFKFKIQNSSFNGKDKRPNMRHVSFNSEDKFLNMVWIFQQQRQTSSIAKINPFGFEGGMCDLIFLHTG